ncbi:DNA/RNA nuclease SfsA [Clostridium sp. 'White wine YQ']|uniref:DNA/RNA nuclease SfsA n=1 Tax=Clostridium sp. 'White wine YQ' TaxID=3027474 RepID=UPI0023661237|nr:DNA/RNA nuclease SfsA [Clostridium sp. 'White wine YQ']MDD7795034.1 DNA/RNA nuclease SfsA [Clostridium sp. 'White wine YQ']
MEFKNNIEVGVFLERPNRFNAKVVLNGEEIVVHVPNTGRCREILKPNTKVILREELNPSRKTKYDLIAAYKDESKLINIDSQIPNKVVKEALQKRIIKELSNYEIIESEKFYGSSRFDFRLTNSLGEVYYLEVKGVTLELHGKASFPDAPTERGTKHVLELIEAKKNGNGAGIMFLIQMEEILSFTPNYSMDSKFGEAVKFANKNGVDIYAYSCKVTEKSIEILKEIEVKL